MLVPEKPVVYYAVFFETFYDSLEDAVSKAPEVITAHRARSKKRAQVSSNHCPSVRSSQ